MWDRPYLPPTPTAINAMVPQRAVVLVVSAATVDVRLTRSRASRHQVPFAAGLSLAVGDEVVLAHFDGDLQTPIVLAKL